jgi:hypothetical protein
MREQEYRWCVGCGVLTNAAYAFCGDTCREAFFAAPTAGWQPSGYVNVYRLQPYQPADMFEALTASDCWTNELNETARRTLSDACWLLVGFVGLVAMVVIAGAAGGLS